MNLHKQIIGICWLVFGALILSFLVTKLDSDNLLVMGGILASLIYLVAGFTLLANIRRSHWICLPCSVLSLFSFPIGTVLGIYYLWYYFRIEQVR